MERGGTAALQFTFRNAHPPAAVAYGPRLSSRRRNSLRSTRGAATRPQLLSGQLWCHPCLHRRKHMPMDFVTQHSAVKAFSSNRPEETSLCSEKIQKEFLIDCGADQECVIGGIVALGKFDALHIGHRELVIQASKAGTPFLLSFVGIGEVLGWEPSRFYSALLSFFLLLESEKYSARLLRKNTMSNATWFY